VTSKPYCHVVVVDVDEEVEVLVLVEVVVVEVEVLVLVEVVVVVLVEVVVVDVDVDVVVVDVDVEVDVVVVVLVEVVVVVVLVEVVVVDVDVDVVVVDVDVEVDVVVPGSLARLSISAAVNTLLKTAASSIRASWCWVNVAWESHPIENPSTQPSDPLPDGDTVPKDDPSKNPSRVVPFHVRAKWWKLTVPRLVFVEAGVVATLFFPLSTTTLFVLTSRQ